MRKFNKGNLVSFENNIGIFIDNKVLDARTGSSIDSSFFEVGIIWIPAFNFKNLLKVSTSLLRKIV